MSAPMPPQQVQAQPYGYPQGQGYYAPPAPTTPGLAVAGFVCSLAGIFFVPVILSIVGIVLSVYGRREARQKHAPTGLATAGIWIGAVTIGLVAAFFLLVIIIAIVSGSSSTSTVIF